MLTGDKAGEERERASDDSPGDRCSDIVEKCLEALIDRERTSYIGDLVQGLIHNVNGPLHNISMLLEMFARGREKMDKFVRSRLQGSVEEWEALHDKQAKRMEQMSLQLSVLIEMLRDFMVLREAERSEQDVDLILVIRRLARIFRADLFYKHNVLVELRLPEAMPPIRIPGDSLVPAFVYIFKNAITAMRASEEKRLTVEYLREEERVRVVVKDTGCGPAEGLEADAAFDLFYSAWPQGVLDACKGESHYGFGLYAARRLLEPYGATLELTREGEETRVVVDIPVTAAGP